MSESDRLARKEAPLSSETAVVAPDFFKEFFEQQRKELEIKAGELELRKQEDDHQFEFGRAALEAQRKDRTEQREHAERRLKTILAFSLGAAVLAVGLLGFALYLDKDAFAVEIVRAAVYVFSGGAGGYALGRHRRTHREASPQKDKVDE